MDFIRANMRISPKLACEYCQDVWHLWTPCKVYSDLGSIQTQTVSSNQEVYLDSVYNLYIAMANNLARSSFIENDDLLF